MDLNKAKIINVIIATRVSQLRLARATAEQHGFVYLKYDRGNRGAAVARNEAIHELLKIPDIDDRYIRFVDDDDIALSPFGYGWDRSQKLDPPSNLIITSYMSNKHPIVVTEPWIATLDACVSGNWFVRVSFVRRVVEAFGNFYDPKWCKDLGYLMVKRMLSIEPTVAVFPDVFSYVHRQGFFPDSMSNKPSGESVLHSLITDSREYNEVDGYMRYARAKGIKTHAVKVFEKYRARTGYYPNFGAYDFSSSMAKRCAFDSRQVISDFCDKAITREWAAYNSVPTMPGFVLRPDELTIGHLRDPSMIFKVSRASRRNVYGTPDPEERERRFHQMKGWLQDSFARRSMEFGYLGDINVVCEKVLDKAFNLDVYCFNGTARYIEWRWPGIGTQMLTWPQQKPLDVHFHKPRLYKTPVISDHTLNEIVSSAEKLAPKIDFVRVDFLVSLKDTIPTFWVFNEMSPYANGLGNVPVTEDGALSQDRFFGRYWVLDPGVSQDPSSVLLPNEIDKAFGM